MASAREVSARLASHLRSFRHGRIASVMRTGKDPSPPPTAAKFALTPRPGSPYSPTPEAVRAAVRATRWGGPANLGWQPEGTPPAIRVRPKPYFARLLGPLACFSSISVWGPHLTGVLCGGVHCAGSGYTRPEVPDH
jgi:hypothetical protein